MQIERLFQYDDWANREDVTRLRNINLPAALRLLGHVIGAQWWWIARIRGENAKMPVWPELTLEQCENELDPLRDAWREILQNVDRDRKVEYKSSKGDQWTSSVDDILAHIAMHGTYHRGQIATAVRQGGEVPVSTDYIHAVRTGRLDGRDSG